MAEFNLVQMARPERMAEERMGGGGLADERQCQGREAHIRPNGSVGAIESMDCSRRNQRHVARVHLHSPFAAKEAQMPLAQDEQLVEIVPVATALRRRRLGAFLRQQGQRERRVLEACICFKLNNIMRGIKCRVPAVQQYEEGLLGADGAA